MKNKLLTIILSMFLIGQTAISAPFNANAKTKRIPAGTHFSFELLNSITTTSTVGTEFSAILLKDYTVESDVVLPAGSLVRGTIMEITPAKRLSRGAILYLDFDHIVTPNGRQIPVSLTVGMSYDTPSSYDINYDGGIITSKGYKEAVKQNWDKSVDIAKNATEWGIDTGDNFWNGYGKIITVPTGAVGGGIGGGAYFVGDSAADLFRKGKEVQINKGDKLEVILTSPIDIPVI